MDMPCKLLTTALFAASAAAVAVPAAAAPITAPSSLRSAATPAVELVQWWGPGPYYDYYAPGYVYGGWGWNPGGAVLAPEPAPGYTPAPGYAPAPGPVAAPGYASGYQAGAADVAACLERYRSYDPASRTYMGRDHRRHPCP